MSNREGIYIGSACLERTRWGSRQPSFLVSDWLARFQADGFDGIELWEFHYLRADAAEQERLAAAAPIAPATASTGTYATGVNSSMRSSNTCALRASCFAAYPRRIAGTFSIGLTP